MLSLCQPLLVSVVVKSTHLFGSLSQNPLPPCMAFRPFIPPRVSRLRIHTSQLRSNSLLARNHFLLQHPSFGRSLQTTAAAQDPTLSEAPQAEIPINGTKVANQLPPVNITPPVTTYPPSTATDFKAVHALTPTRLLGVYSQLSKARLTTLVVLTAMSGVALSPLPATLPVLLGTAAGTALCSASVNTINQIIEIPFDAQMARTRNRPLVRKAITPLHAAAFAVGTGIAGPAILWTLVNPTTAALGVLNMVLYAGVYTPLKRVSIVNTWVGSVVGGLPPLMGWAACNGHIIPTTTHPILISMPPFLPELSTTFGSLIQPAAHAAADNPLSAITLFLFLFSWQFPHFHAISHLVRTSYAQGGYKMLSVVDPTKNALVALRHSVLLAGICSGLAPLAGLTTWTFALTSLVPNAVLLRSSWRFYRKTGDKEARRLWQDCLWYMPVILGLMMFHKPGVNWIEELLGLGGDDSETSRGAAEVSNRT